MLGDNNVDTSAAAHLAAEALGRPERSGGGRLG
jgi:hypothetical protein